jgi:hypothetical protein
MNILHRVKLILGIMKEATRHEDVWRSGDIAPLLLIFVLGGAKWLASHLLFTHREPTHSTSCIDCLVDPANGLN